MNTKSKTKIPADIGHIGAVVAHRLDLYACAIGDIEPENLHALVMGEVEKALIQWVAVSVGHNQSRAAEWLGVSRPTLRAKLNAYGIRTPAR